MKAILAASALLAGCALIQPAPKPLQPKVSLVERASTLTVAKSTKAEVRAALGEGTVVDFPSGYEVWVYRESPPAASELVLLFDPAGTLAKTRVR